jgi:hypothetical protein
VLSTAIAYALSASLDTGGTSPTRRCLRLRADHARTKHGEGADSVSSPATPTMSACSSAACLNSQSPHRSTGSREYQRTTRATNPPATSARASSTDTCAPVIPRCIQPGVCPTSTGSRPLLSSLISPSGPDSHVEDRPSAQLAGRISGAEIHIRYSISAGVSPRDTGVRRGSFEGGSGGCSGSRWLPSRPA